MNYQILNQPVSIRIACITGIIFLMKENVKDISLVHGDTIRISSGNCFSSICIHHRNVTEPATTNAIELVDLLNEMMSPFEEVGPSR